MLYWTRLILCLLLCANFAAAPAITSAPSTTSELWSLRRVERPDVPPVKDSSWVGNPIDAFILARLQSQGLQPAPQADKQTLIRRLTFDLTGLPPTPEEIRAFLKDDSPEAYEKLVERLLASPHYGEKWGRHWLDVARYTPGRINFIGVKNTNGDQRYRDYVVRAFNNDKPYDRFLTEQLAGDLLSPVDEREQYLDQITAPAFLSIGPWFDQCTDPNRLKLEMIDEMINTTSQAFMGLTVSCARCHDHKFDPIPTKDYYALAGIFGSTKIVDNLSEFWRDGRVRQLRPLAMPEEVAANERVRAQIETIKAKQWDFLKERHTSLLAQWQHREAEYRAAAARIGKPFVLAFEAEDFNGQDNLRIAQLMKDGVGSDVIETQTPSEPWVKYTLEVPATGSYRLEAFYSSGESTPLTLLVNGEPATKTALSQPTGGWDLKYQRWASLTESPVRLRKGENFIRIIADAGTFPRIDRFRLISEQTIAAPEGLDPRIIRNFLLDPNSPWPTVPGIVAYLPESDLRALEALSNDAARLERLLKPYEMVVAVTDEPKPNNLPVHVKGETYTTAGDPVARGFLSLTDRTVTQPTVSGDRSGRLELAEWLTDRNHPLTSRVMVNRIWQWHFGRGIVATPSDFGTRGEPPTHPELLDWLAAEFMENGWSIKHLHRLIVMSSTYRMSGKGSEQALERDPDNKLLSHFPRRRLSAEEIYDAMRSTTNMIPRQEPGAALDINKSGQRAVYILTNGRNPVSATELRKFFALFDADLSGVHVASRTSSSTPAQSLFFLNNPLPKYMADRFAQRLLKMDKLNDAKRVEMAHLLALGRPPSKDIQAKSLAFLEQCKGRDGMNEEEAWSKLCQAIYAAAEFRYVE